VDALVSLRFRWLLAPALAFLVVFFLYPLIDVLSLSVTEPEVGVGNYREFADSRVFGRVLWNTLRLSALVTVCCVVLGYPYAYLMARSGSRMRAVLLVAVLVPLWSSILVRTYAWTVLLQRNGVVNSILMDLGLVDEPVTLLRNSTGLVIGMTHILLPFMVLPAYAVMRRVDLDLLVAAESLGARPARAFAAVFLPLSLPGVLAGALLVFVVALGYYITPALLGGPGETMMGAMVVEQIQDVRDWGMGATLAVVLLVVTAAILAVLGRLVRLDRVLGGERA
jgi:putative spermidine/putrescine transport system permease protein